MHALLLGRLNPRSRNWCLADKGACCSAIRAVQAMGCVEAELKDQ